MARFFLFCFGGWEPLARRQPAGDEQGECGEAGD
jgi:hypothetical protein